MILSDWKAKKMLFTELLAQVVSVSIYEKQIVAVVLDWTRPDQPMFNNVYQYLAMVINNEK